MQASSYGEEIYRIFADTGRPTDEQIDRALDIGTAYFDLSIGFLTRIEDGPQEIVRATGDHDPIQPGETCPLDEAYCRRTLETDGPLAVADGTVATVHVPAIDEGESVETVARRPTTLFR